MPIPSFSLWALGFLLIYLGIKKNMEPGLLIPMGFGAILVNLPNSGAITQEIPGVGQVVGILDWLYQFGIEGAEAFPLLLFIGIGAMIDFGPLLSNPKLMFFGAASQLGIFVVLIIASLFLPLNDAASIAIIAAADGPTAIMLANLFKTEYLAPILVVAYSYMALVPIIQPVAIKMVTTKKERAIKMKYNPQSVSKATRILFPICVTIIAGLIAPISVALVGCLMFGNLLRECGVLDNLSESASKVLANLITLVLGLSIASTMTAEAFIKWEFLMIIALGLFGFVFDTIGGVLFAKLLNLFLKEKINPMVGGCGISAFPMSARVVQKMGLEADPTNHLLMHAVGANVSGQIASVIAGGVLMSLIPGLM